MNNIEKIKINVNKLNHITNTYVVFDSNKIGVLIDPADEVEKIIECITRNKVELKYVLITHAHADHIGALEGIVKRFGAEVLVSKEDYSMLFCNDKNCSKMLGNMDIGISPEVKEKIKTIKDGEIFKAGEISLEVISTPGHTKGSVCFYEAKDKVIFTGDTIFSNCCGRCDLATSSMDDMIVSLNKIFDKFENIKNELKVYPGHGQLSSLEVAEKKIKLFLAITKGINL
mgnify:FL=1